MGQGGDICKDALREAGNVIAMERPAENRRFCNAQGSKVGSKDCGPGVGGRAGPHHPVTCKYAFLCTSCNLYPPHLHAPRFRWAQGTQGHGQQQRRGQAGL